MAGAAGRASDEGRRARRDALAEDALPSAGCDAVLVTDLLNVRYLTGFTGSNARAAGARRRRGRPVRHRRPLHHPGRHQAPDVELLVDRGAPCRRWRAPRCSGRRAGSATSRTTSPSTGSPRWRRCWPAPADGARAGVVRRAGRDPARDQGRRRDRARCAGPARWPTRRWPSWPPRVRCGPGAPSCEVGRELDARMLDARRRGAVRSRRSWPPARTRRSRTTGPTRRCCATATS